MNNLLNLNQSQIDAVQHFKSPLLVLAGAGSGKTKVITEKIIFASNKFKHDNELIVAITFTNKAAKEMLERIKIFNKKDKNILITTFHSFGLGILRKEANYLNYRVNFSIFDEYDCIKIIGEFLNTNDKKFILEILSKISYWKNNFILPETAIVDNMEDKKFLSTTIIDCYRHYQQTLKSCHAVDFDDLILLPIFLFNNHPQLLNKWQNKISYLLVDEYQDTNECQYRMIKLLCKKNNNFTIVGDDDQSIYGFRGANSNNLLNIKNDFNNLCIIKLEQNYRSTNTILTAANNIIKNNNNMLTKTLWSNFGNGDSIKIVSFKNEELQAEEIIKKIRLHNSLYNTKLSDYAVLYRSNFQSRILEQYLKSSNINYNISGGKSFFDNYEIKDILSYLRLVVNDKDDVSFIRALISPKRGIGNLTIDKLTTYAKFRNIPLFHAMLEEGFLMSINPNQIPILQNFSKLINTLKSNLDKIKLSDLLNDLMKSIAYDQFLYNSESSLVVAEKKLDNINSFISWLGKKSDENSDAQEIIQKINLISILENNDNNNEQAINLSTIHAAKGLEYQYVYLLSCNEGILPHQESIHNNNIDEERRLMYVAITRAKKELTISYCLQRKIEKEMTVIEKSRFIDEIGLYNIIDENKEKMQKIDNKEDFANRIKQLKELLNK